MANQLQITVAKNALETLREANEKLDNAIKDLDWRDMVANGEDEIAYAILQKQGFGAGESFNMVTKARRRAFKPIHRVVTRKLKG